MSDWRIRVHYVDSDGDPDHEDVHVHDEPGEVEAIADAVERVEAVLDEGEEYVRVEVLDEWK